MRQKIIHKLLNQGFSIVEIIVATFMGTVVFVGAYTWWNVSLKQFVVGVGTINNSEQAQRSLRAMTDVLREARDGEDGAYPMALADDQELIIYSDVTGDLMADRVRYFLDGNELKRGVIEPAGDPTIYDPNTETVTVLATGVENGTEPIFYYYNAAWPADTVNNPLAAGNRLLASRYLEIQIMIDQDGDVGSPPVNLQAGAQLRNLKDDY